MEVVNQAVHGSLISFLEKSLTEGSNLPAKKQEKKNQWLEEGFLISGPSLAVNHVLLGPTWAGSAPGFLFYPSDIHSLCWKRTHAIVSCQNHRNASWKILVGLILFNHVSLIPLLISLYRLKSYHVRLYGLWFVSDLQNFRISLDLEAEHFFT